MWEQCAQSRGPPMRTLVRACQCYWNVAQTCEMCMHPPPRGVCTLALQRARPLRGARGGARGSFEQCSASAAPSSSAAQRQWPLWSYAAAGGPVRWRRSVGSGRAVGSRAGCRVSLAGEKRQGLPCILGAAQKCAVPLLRRRAASMRIAASGVGASSGAVVGQHRGARAPRVLHNKRSAWAGALSLSGAQL